MAREWRAKEWGRRSGDDNIFFPIPLPPFLCQFPLRVGRAGACLQGFQDGLDFGGDEGGAFFPGEAGGLRVAAGGKLAAEGFVGPEAGEGVAEAGGVAGVEVEDGVAADFGEAGGVRAGDGQAGAQGLDDGEAEALGDGGLHIREGVGVGPGEFGVGDVAGLDELAGARGAAQERLDDVASVVGGAGAEEHQQREIGVLGLELRPDFEQAALIFIFRERAGVEEEGPVKLARPNRCDGRGRAEVGGAAGDDAEFFRVAGEDGGEPVLAVLGKGEDAPGAPDGERGAEPIEMVARALAAGDPGRAVFVEIRIENIGDEGWSEERREAGGREAEAAAGASPRGTDLEDGAGEKAAAGNEYGAERFGVRPEGIVAALGDGDPLPGNVETEEFEGLVKDVPRRAGGAVGLAGGGEVEADAHGGHGVGMGAEGWVGTGGGKINWRGRGALPGTGCG